MEIIDVCNVCNVCNAKSDSALNTTINRDEAGSGDCVQYLGNFSSRKLLANTFHVMQGGSEPHCHISVGGLSVSPLDAMLCRCC